VSYVQVFTILALSLGFGALAFSLVALFRVKERSELESGDFFSHPRTSSIMIRLIDREDFLLSLIAAYDVRVKEMLAVSPHDAVVVGLEASGPPENKSRGFVSPGAVVDECREEVSIDLGENPKLRPLFETILYRTKPSVPTEVSVA
jgi:hypothetical protein